MLSPIHFRCAVSILVFAVAVYCCPQPASASTGWFTVETINATSWFQDPQSHLFLSKGVTCVNRDGLNATDFIRSAENSLLSWNFNTLGGWTYELENTSLPYTVVMSFVSLLGDSTDWFSTEFLSAADSYAKNICEIHRNNKRLLGYFTDNEIFWGSYVDEWPVVERETGIFLIKYLNLPSNSTGRQFALRWLKEKYYNNIKLLNLAWQISAASFETITLAMPFLRPSYIRVRDYDEFIAIASSIFFEIKHNVIRKYDPNHLILGSRYTYWEMPMSVVKAEAPFVDVISYNGYVWWPGFNIRKVLDRLYAATGKPILISEFSFRAFDNKSKDPNIRGAGWPVLTQSQRADAYTKYISEVASAPYIVGWHWFQWRDEPPGGRAGDGENSNFGLLNYTNDVYYDTLISAMTIANYNADVLHRNSSRSTK